MVKVVDYLLDKLAALGVKHVFGVPGDYAFPLNDAITAREDMRWIGCSNELNAAYAADGYARIRGIAAINTTYGVGELSAINAVAGSYAEHVPVVHLVGMPRRTVMASGKIVHHMLGTGRNEAFYEAAGHVVSARTILDGQNCEQELERLFTVLQKERRPIYIGVPFDAAHDEVVHKEQHTASLPKKDGSVAHEVARKIIAKIKQSKQPCVLPSMVMARFGCRDLVKRFLEQSHLPYATMFMDKTIVSEHLPNFVGMYCGHLVQQRVATFVEQSDLIIGLGVELTDFNTGLFTDHIARNVVIHIGPEGVRFGGESLIEVAPAEVMAALVEQIGTLPQRDLPGYLGDDLPAKMDDETSEGNIRTHTLYAALTEILKPGDIIVGETGTVSMGMGFVRLPKDVQFEDQSLWGSIGWATPAAFGVAMAAPGRRVILLTGEGSHQLTVQAMGEFARYGCHPLVIVLNNEGYLIERLLCDDGEQEYNDIAQWDYSLLARGFGCHEWLCQKVHTPHQLENTLKLADSHPSKGAYIEVIAPRYDAPPMAKALGGK